MKQGHEMAKKRKMRNALDNIWNLGYNLEAGKRRESLGDTKSDFEGQIHAEKRAQRAISGS